MQSLNNVTDLGILAMTHAFLPADRDCSVNCCAPPPGPEGWAEICNCSYLERQSQKITSQSEREKRKNEDFNQSYKLRRIIKDVHHSG